MSLTPFFSANGISVGNLFNPTNVVLANGSITAGNTVSANYFVGNGAFLTGLPAGYSNANVAAYLPDYQGQISNIDFRSTSPAAVALVSNSRPLTMGGNTLSYVTLPDDANANVIAAELTNHGIGNVLISSGPDDHEWIFDYTGNLRLPGNTWSVYYANGTQVPLGVTTSYGNTDVSNYLASDANVNILTTGNITSSANISGGYLLGNGAFITGLPAAYTNANVKTYLESGNTINANFGGGNITTTGTATFGATQVNGNLNISGNINATGNITYISVQDLVISDPIIYLGANNSADLVDIGIVGSFNDGTYQHTGVVRDHTDDTWKVFTGVTNEPNTVVDWSQAVYAPLKSGAFTSNASIQANTTITAVGNISGANVTTVGSVDALGNISGAYILGNGAYITGLPASYSNANVANYLASNAAITILTTGNITTAANISGAYLLGNGAYITGLPAGYSNANVADYLASNSNVTITTTSNISTTANITADYYLGNGSQLTGLPGNTTVSNTAPANPSQGDWWIQANTGTQFVYFESGGNSQWAEMEADTSISITGGTYGNPDVASYLASNANVTITTTGDITTTGNVTANNINGTVNVNTRKRTVNYIIDGGGIEITTGSKGYVVVDANCVINGWTILLDQSGNANVDVRRSTYANFPTTVSIAGNIPPAAVSAVKAQDTTLNGWGNITIASGDILEFVVQGTPANATRMTVSLNLTNT